MSIELLPSDKPKIRGKYHVEANCCNCHPETCCCNDWVLNNPKGKKITTFFNKDDAQEVADKLNT